MPMPLSLTLTTASPLLAARRDRDARRRGWCTSRRCSAGWRTPASAAPDRRRRTIWLGVEVDDEISWRRLSSTGRLVSIAALTIAREIERLLLDLDDAARDARHFEQIVDEAVEVMDLPLHHRAGRRGARVLERARQLQDLEAVRGSARADCAARGRAWRGIRPCGDRRCAAPARSSAARRGGRGSDTGASARESPSAPRSAAW